MELIAYLKQFGIAQLEAEYNIKVNESLTFPELVTLCYDQMKTPKNAITNECRGIVLNKHTFEVVAYPFTRFGDYDPKKETNFDFSNFKCFEKIDGSMILLYFYQNKWNIATKSLPDGRGKIIGMDKSYEQLFWEVWEEKGFEMPTNPDFTYIFELKYPSERQYLTQTERNTLALIGLRNVKTYQEMDIQEALQHKVIPNWELVPSKPLTNIKAVWELALSLNPSVDEGFVLQDAQFNRLKVKSPAYELIALLRNNHDDPVLNTQIHRDNFKRLLKIAKYSTATDFLKRFPNCKADFERILQAKPLLLEKLAQLLAEVRPLEGAEFGQYCKKSPFQKFIFHLKKADDVALFLESCSDTTFSEMILLILKENGL